MLSKYISNWFNLFFILWLLGYIFNINIIIKYINPYYTSILSLILFSIFIIYLLKKYTFEYTFLFIIIIAHVLPVYLSYMLIKDKHKYALENLIILISLYIIYTQYINVDIYKLYMIDSHPTNWKEYFKSCKGKKYIPYCFLFKDT
jgi:hypothetical protein